MLSRSLCLILAGAALAVCLSSAGCQGKGDLGSVKVGMGPIDVERIMGAPTEKIRGDYTDVDKTLWVYPQGRVLFVCWEVVKVEKNADQETTEEPRR